MDLAKALTSQGAWSWWRWGCLLQHVSDFHLNSKNQRNGDSEIHVTLPHMKQTSFFKMNDWNKPFVPETGKRKIKRPLSTKRPIHLILRSSKHNLRKNERQLTEQWSALARKFGVKTYRMVVASNHVHAIVRLHSQNLYNKFIQALTGTLSRRLQIKWKTRPTTRVAQWGRDFKRLKQYLQLNFLEANQIVEYQPSRTRDLPNWLKL